jgi:ribosomal RNA-processing protein 12
MNAITIVCNIAENAENICTPLYNTSILFTQLFCDLDSMSMDLVKMVLENVCLLMTTRTREIVGSALSFIKMFLTSFSYDTVAPEVPHIVSIIFSGNHESFGK